MANFPNWNPATVVGTTAVSTFSKAIQSNIVLFQIDLKAAMRAARSLDAYMGQTLDENGVFVTGIIRHDHVANPTASQHHTMAHGADHRNGTDDIQSASAAQIGLMTATQFSTLQGVVSAATYNPTVVSKYTGTTAATLVVSLGFWPSLVNVWRSGGGTSPVWEKIRGNPRTWMDRMGSGLRVHRAGYYVSVFSSGMRLINDANVTNVVYWYKAVR